MMIRLQSFAIHSTGTLITDLLRQYTPNQFEIPKSWVTHPNTDQYNTQNKRAIGGFRSIITSSPVACVPGERGAGFSPNCPPAQARENSRLNLTLR